MQRLIFPQNLHQFAAIRDEGLRRPVRGVLLTFHGFGYQEMNPPISEFDRECAEQGLLVVFPYCGPWSWMNFTTVNMIDQIVRTVYEVYKIDPSAPLISSGGSMGGLASLIYTRYAGKLNSDAIVPVACLADSPVCDLICLYKTRDEAPRALFSAFGNYPMPFEEALKTASPIHQVDNLPNVPYLIVHGTADTLVPKIQHSDQLVPLLKKEHQVGYIEVEGMEHCAMPVEAWNQYRQFIFRHSGIEIE